jgi:hypothetical protein
VTVAEQFTGQSQFHWADSAAAPYLKRTSLC